MPTPPNASSANADSLTDKTALKAAANSQFIDQAGQAILAAEAEGRYFVVLTTFKDCDILGLQTYFIGLGYAVSYPDLLNPNLSPFNPAELFGADWNNYWNRNSNFPHLKNPVRIKLDWSLI